MSDTPSFGMWLRQRRKRHDLTQAELARQVGCALGTLRNIETDSARPSKQLAARLACLLGVADENVSAMVAFARGTGAAPTDWDSLPGAPIPPPPFAPTHSRRANLPAQLTGLIGRTHEVEAVRTLLLRPDVRLVTLSGPGGTGKTRLAVASALQLLDAFPAGVAFVDLAAITDPDLVLATIAQTLGVTDSGRQPLHVHLAAALRDQALLLLLDNFEQVIAAAPAVVELLTACPQLKVLITSRIALGLAGEYEWPIPPLALPDRAPLPPFEQLTQYESVRLFGERARAVNPQFAITTSNAPAVAEICHQLDGLPLAIELVAAWVKLFEPQALLTRLDHRLTFLTGGGRDRPTRQQTMRNTIDWSYQLLTPAEQLLFQRLSVFMGGGTLSAIEAVCGDLDGEVVDGVSALVSQSLLRILPVSPGETEAEPRVGMLETIREYALEQLATSPDAETIRQRHAHYFTALAEAAATRWDSPTGDAAIAQLNREYDNMRAALQWARDGGDGTLGLQLAGALRKFWQSRGYFSEGRAWLEELLALDDATPDSTALATRLRATHTAAWLASDQHDYARAAQLFEQSLALRQALGEKEGEPHLLAHDARQARAAGQYAHATALLEDRLAQYRSAGDRGSWSTGGLGLALYELGLALREQGNFSRATVLFAECVAFHREIGDREGMAIGLLGLGDVARDQGDVVRMQTYGEESLAILQKLGVQWAIGFALNNLALGAYLERDLTRAAALVDESIAVFQDLQADASRAEVLITLGHIVLAQEDGAAAYAALAEALRLASALGPRLLVATALEGLASVVVAWGQTQLAVQCLAAAAALREQMGTPVRPVDRPAVDHALTIARSALDADAFAAMWAEVQAMPLDQILSALPSSAAFAALGDRAGT